MTDYQFMYRMNQSPEARNDGSGMVSHDIDAVAREQGSSDPWIVIPARHKTVLIPASDLLTVMAMADGSGVQKTVKNAAYKVILASNLNTQAVPIVGWSASELETLMDANDLSVDAATQADDYIINTLGQSYPIQFSF